MYNSTCQLTGAIMSTQSCTLYQLFTGSCVVAPLASWLSGTTQGQLCHVHGLPSQPWGIVIHCPLLVQTPFKLVSLTKPDPRI